MPIEVMKVVREDTPKKYQARLLVEVPTLAQVDSIFKLLQANGVPPTAEIRFQQWSTPSTSYYIIATWED